MSELILHQFVTLKSDGPDTTKVRPSSWNQNHIVAEDLLNSSGGTVFAGETLVMNNALNNSVTVSTQQGELRPVVIALGSIGDGQIGNFTVRGLSGGVKVQGAVAIGQHLRVSATAKHLEAIPNSENTGHAVGSVGIARTSWAGPGAGVCNVLLWGHTQHPSFLKGADIASASALSPDLGAQYFRVTGTTTINTIAARAAGTLLVLRFDGLCKVENSANIILLSNGAFMDSGHIMVLISEGGGVWREIDRSNLNVLDPAVNTTFYDDFQSLSNVLAGAQGLLTTGQASWRVNDNAAAAAVANLVTGQTGGVIRIGGTAAAGMSMYLTRDGSSNNSLSDPFLVSKQFTMKFRAAMVDNTATGTRRIGVGTDAAQDFTVDPDSGIYIRFAHNANYIAVVRNSNTETTLDTGVAVDLNFHNFQFNVGTGTVGVLVDGSNKGTISTNLPSAAMTAFMSTGTGTNACRLDCDYIHIVQGR